MNHPDLLLMRRYGTEHVFYEKTAGASPFAARIAAAVFGSYMVHSAGREMNRQQLEAHQLNEQFRLAEERMMAPVNQGLRHTRAPMFLQANSDVPVGWDEGMTRLASIAQAAGRDMATKEAGLGQYGTAAVQGLKAVGQRAAVAGAGAARAVQGRIAGMGNAAKTVATAAPAAAEGGTMMQGLLGKHWKAKALGYGALAGGSLLASKGMNAGLGVMSRPARTANWGAPGMQIPMGVNQYDEPQLGTSLMG